MFHTFSIALRLGQLINFAMHVAQVFAGDLVMMPESDLLVSTISLVNRLSAALMTVVCQ